jgi:hypothetical protein
MGEEFVILEDEAHVPPEIGDGRGFQVKGVHALDDDLPFIGMFRAEYDLEERAFSRAAGAGKKHELALFHVEAYIAQGGNALIVFGNPVKLDHDSKRIIRSEVLRCSWALKKMNRQDARAQRLILNIGFLRILLDFAVSGCISIFIFAIVNASSS